jgi:hypothetical protein
MVEKVIIDKETMLKIYKKVYIIIRYIHITVD